MSDQGQVKGQNETFSHFELSDGLDGLQSAQTNPKFSICQKKDDE